VIATPTKAAVSSVLVLDRPAFMPSGTRSMESAKGGTGRKGPARPEPLAPFAKYQNNAKGWQGPAVILEGPGPGAMLFERFSHNAPSGPQQAVPGEAKALGVQHGGTDSSSAPATMRLKEENAELRAQLEEARKAAAEWRELHSQLHEFTVQNLQD